MNCQRCGSDRIVTAGAKCSDLFNASIMGHSMNGSVPKFLGIGAGDYLKFRYCLSCGQMQGEFPLLESDLERREEPPSEGEDNGYGYSPVRKY